MTLPDWIGDYHIHTRFSCDSKSEMTEVCESAIAQGIREIAITDHADFGPDDPPGYFRPVEYLETIEHCRARYRDRLRIRTGVEIGEPHIFAQETQTILNAGAFDFVIGSAHYAALLAPAASSKGACYLQCAWKGSFFQQPLRQAYEAYFRQVVRLAAEGDFDVLGHLDLVKRDAHQFGKPYDGPEPYADMIRTALRSVVERGKGIEINTSALYKGKGMSEPCPSLEILRWYRELGGEILTVGSDAHTPDKVGAHFDVAVEMARAAGFTRLATFERRQVYWNRIIDFGTV
jgi:histidinol-phosphatase (PHP family)